MSQKIHIQDLTAPRYKIFISAGLLLFLIAALAWYVDATPVIYYAASALAIGCFFAISYNTFTTTNVVSVDRYGATFKLLGNKTYGFRFIDMRQVDLLDRGLLITFNNKEMEPVKLSRKRYNSQSLQDIHTLLKTKNNNNERR